MTVDVIGTDGNRKTAWGIWMAPRAGGDLDRQGIDVDPSRLPDKILYDIEGARSRTPAFDAGPGTVTWRGGLVAADQADPEFPPVFGRAVLTMDLSDTDRMDVAFTGLKLVGRNGTIASLGNLPTYTLSRSGRRWKFERHGVVSVGATFFSVGSDPVGAVAGEVASDELSGREIRGNFAAVKQ